MIAYPGWALNQAESHYAPSEGECLASVWAPYKFSRYLHGCKRFELQYVAETRTPRMSGPFRPVHIGLAGPFALRHVKAQPVNGRAGRTKATLSIGRTAQVIICLMVAYLTKAAEFAPMPDKSSDNLAHDVHDYWFMLYGIPE